MLAQRAALGVAAFAKAAGENRGAACARLTRRADGVDGGGAGNQHHHMVGLAGQGSQIRIAGLSIPHGVDARVYRIDGPLVAAALEDAKDALGPAAVSVACAHDGDAGGVEQGAHLLDA